MFDIKLFQSCCKGAEFARRLVKMDSLRTTLAYTNSRIFSKENCTLILEIERKYLHHL